MASSPTVSAPAAKPAGNPKLSAGGPAQADAQALVPAPAAAVEEIEPEAWSGPVAKLPVELDVAVPVRGFRVRNLLAIEPGHVVESQWGHAEDLPLASADVQLAWAEFEVVDTRLAVRITRLC